MKSPDEKGSADLKGYVEEKRYGGMYLAATEREIGKQGGGVMVEPTG